MVMEMKGKRHIREVEAVGLCDGLMRVDSKRGVKNELQVFGLSNWVVGCP